MNKNTVYRGAIIFLLSLFAACDMTGPAPEGAAGYGGLAAVRVQIGGAGTGARTVRPADALQEVDLWRLYGGKSGADETQLTEFSSAEEAELSLEPGAWSFTLTGYKDSAVILTGSIAQQNITLDAENTLVFTVAPASEEGEGTVSIVIELPAGSGITAARIFKDGTELETPVTPVDDRIAVTGTFPVGAYYFSVRLYNGDDLYGVVSEAVYVWANLESAKTYTLAQENLNLTYVITYDVGEGETETGYYRYTDAAVTLLAEPTRAGYAFEGWYDNAGFNGEPVTQIPAGSTGDKDFYAKWGVPSQYTVTFDADGGSPATETRTVDSGGSLGSPITNITYGSVSGSTTWTLLADGRRRSPAIGHGYVTKSRISFTSNGADASIEIQLEVSSESGFDFAFISTLDNADASYSSGYYAGSLISGSQSVTVTIPVPTAGSHFIDIGYRKDGSASSGSDCAWFKVISGDSGDSGMPSEPTKTGYTFGGWYTQQNGGGTQFTADTTVSANITVYARWTFGVSVHVQVLQPALDPPLSNTSVPVNEEAQFSAGSGYGSYQWYWDGEAIDGADSQDYTLEAGSKPIGVYELSVVVETDAGERRSARCRVRITSN